MKYNCTKDNSTIDSSLSNNSDYTTCICQSQSLLSGSSSAESYCQTWKKEYVTYMAVPLCISLGIVIYNVLVSFFYRFITKLEKHKFVVHEEISFTFKRAVLLILNMGVIMILLNVNFSGAMFN